MGYSAILLAIVGTLAIFLLPLPHATAPYPASHGPIGFPRSSRMALMWMMHALLCFFVLLAIAFSSLLAQISGSFAVVSTRLSPNRRGTSVTTSLRC